MQDPTSLLGRQIRLLLPIQESNNYSKSLFNQQSFLINKKQAASVNGLSSASSSPFRNRSGVVKSSSGESLPAGTVGSHPYKIPQPPMQQISVKYPDDFPLRKTGEFCARKALLCNFVG